MDVKVLSDIELFGVFCIKNTPVDSRQLNKKQLFFYWKNARAPSNNGAKLQVKQVPLTPSVKQWKRYHSRLRQKKISSQPFFISLFCYKLALVHFFMKSGTNILNLSLLGDRICKSLVCYGDGESWLTFLQRACHRHILMGFSNILQEPLTFQL